MTVVRCGKPTCQWEVDVPDPAAALDAHERRWHPDTIPPPADPTPGEEDTRRIPQLPDLVWREQAIHAVAQAARTGAEFTVYSALRDAGVADPPSHRTSLGAFTREVARLLDLELVRFDKSARPGTKSSAVAVWRGKPAVDQPAHEARKRA